MESNSLLEGLTRPQAGRHHMPIAHVYVWKGFSEEAKRRVIEGVTKVFADLGIPAEAVEVLIHDVPKEDWGVGGLRASEKLKNARVP